MDYKQHLFYGLGQVAYAVAMADGAVQKEEKEKLEEVLRKEIEACDPDFDFTEIVFKLFERDHPTMEDAYESGMHAMQLGSHKLTPELVEEFLKIIKNIVVAFPPPEKSELRIFERFEKELNALIPPVI